VFAIVRSVGSKVLIGVARHFIYDMMFAFIACTSVNVKNIYCVWKAVFFIPESKYNAQDITNQSSISVKTRLSSTRFIRFCRNKACRVSDKERINLDLVLTDNWWFIFSIANIKNAKTLFKWKVVWHRCYVLYGRWRHVLFKIFLWCKWQHLKILSGRGTN